MKYVSLRLSYDCDNKVQKLISIPFLHIYWQNKLVAVVTLQLIDRTYSLVSTKKDGSKICGPLNVGSKEEFGPERLMCQT